MLQIPQPGTIFSSYPDLARFIGEPPTRGNRMILQMNRWLNHFTWERIPGSHKIIINNFEEPRPPLSSSPRWAKHVAPQIAYELLEVAKGNGLNSTSRLFKELILSGTEAYIQFGLVNPNWTRLKNADLQDIDEEQQLEFMGFSSDKLYHIFYDALKSLRRKGICDFDRIYLVVDNEERRKATTEEEKIIRLLKVGILADMKVYTEYSLYRTKRAREFYAKLGEAFTKKMEADIALSHRAWRVFFFEERLDNALAKVAKHPIVVHRRMANQESFRWHVEQLGKAHGQIINMVIPSKSVLDFLSEEHPCPA